MKGNMENKLTLFVWIVSILILIACWLIYAWDQKESKDCADACKWNICYNPRELYEFNGTCGQVMQYGRVVECKVLNYTMINQCCDRLCK